MTIGASVHAISAYLLRFDEMPEIPIDIDHLTQQPNETEVDENNNSEESITEKLAELQLEYEKLSIDYEAQRKAIETAIDSARQDWVEKESSILAERLVHGFNAAIEKLRVDISRTLVPFINQKAIQISAIELSDALQIAIAATENTIIRVDGPVDLLKGIESEIAKQDSPCEIVVRDGPDITVTFSNSRIETRLEDWRKIFDGLGE